MSNPLLDPSEWWYAKLVGSYLTGFPPAFHGMYVFCIRAKSAGEAHMKIYREHGWTEMFAYHRADDLDPGCGA